MDLLGNFTTVFFYLLGQDLVESFNASYRAGEMAPSQRRAVITLLSRPQSLRNYMRSMRMLASQLHDSLRVSRDAF